MNDEHLINTVVSYALFKNKKIKKFKGGSSHPLLPNEGGRQVIQQIVQWDNMAQTHANFE